MLQKNTSTRRIGNPRYLAALLLVLATGPPVVAAPHNVSFDVPGGNIEIQFTNDRFPLPERSYVSWIETAAKAIVKYYGRFPVHKLVVKMEGTGGGDIGFSTTGFEHGHGEIEIPIGERIKADSLKRNWVATHEMTHLAFPIVRHSRRWVAEGQATYIEPLARVQIGDISREDMWKDMVDHFPRVLADNGGGLDGSDSIERIYWGGALFCLLADMDIHRKSDNRLGLQDALRAVVKAGGNAGSDWSSEQAFRVADEAVHMDVLERLDEKMRAQPLHVDLNKLWSDLGIRLSRGGKIEFNDRAPLAAVRLSIEKGGQ